MVVSDTDDTPPTDEASSAPEVADSASDPEPEAEPPEQEPEPAPFDDEETAAAINDIAAKEGDDTLAEQDVVAAQPPGRSWRRKLLRWTLALLVVGGIVAAVVVPTARYWVLNTAGVRVSASVTVLDDATQMPLKGVELQVAGKKATTDDAGKASLSGLKVGPQVLTIEQAGFGTITRQVVLGWGSNPLGHFALKTVGVTYVIEVHDYLSGKPLAGVSAGNGDVSALSDKNGKITLTLPGAATAADLISLSKDGYRTDQITLGPDPKVSNKAGMVVSRKTVFVVRDGITYNVYKADVDGKNREIVLKGTGSETSNLSLVVSPDGSRAAYVSTRDGKRDTDGFLLNSLALINIDTGQTTTIAQAPQIQLIDWIGSRLVFEQVSAEDAASSSYVVTSYNYADNTRLQLATSSKLQSVQTAQGVIYYAVSADAGSSVQPGLYKIGADGNGKKQVFNTEVETVLRSDYNTFSLQTLDGNWSSYNIVTGTSTQIPTPASLANRLYIDNVARTKSLWINQGALTLHDVASAKDTVLQTQGALAYPVQWFGDTAVVFRLSGGAETADYASSTDSVIAYKVSDVVATYGFAHAQ